MDDIKTVQDNAVLSRLAMQVTLILDVERILPDCIRRRFGILYGLMLKKVKYPKTWQRRIINLLHYLHYTLGCWDYKIIYLLCRFIVKEQTIYPNQKRGIVYNILAEGNNLTRITKGVVQEYNSQVRTGYHTSSYTDRNILDISYLVSKILPGFPSLGVKHWYF